MNNSDVECVITNSNIIEYIFNIGSSVGMNIKKYIFIISKNEVTSNYEFNFINTIFTNNLDIMIKLQNFIYETLNNYNITDDNYSDKETCKNGDKLEILLLFYYQLIIWLFKNQCQYENKYDNNKIIKFFSSLTYRFSILVLKNALKIKNDLSKNKLQINQIIKLKDNLLDEINNKNNINYDSDNENDDDDDDENDNESDEISNNYSDEITSNSDIVSSSIKSHSSINDSTDIYDKINIQKNGKKVNKINELFSDNLLKNINDTVEFDKKSTNSNSNLIREMIKIKEKQNKKNKLSDISEVDSSETFSFNSKSAEKNSKIYNIEI